MQRLISLLFHPKVLAWDLCYGNFCLSGPKEASYLTSSIKIRSVHCNNTRILCALQQVSGQTVGSKQTHFVGARRSGEITFQSDRWHKQYRVWFLHCVLRCLGSVQTVVLCRFWLQGGRGGSAAARLLRLWVRNPPGAGMSVCCECYVLSGRGLCDELITRPEEFYRLWCIVVCDLEISWMRRPWPTGGFRAKNKTKKIIVVYRF